MAYEGFFRSEVGSMIYYHHMKISVWYNILLTHKTTSCCKNSKFSAIAHCIMYSIIYVFKAEAYETLPKRHFSVWNDWSKLVD